MRANARLPALRIAAALPSERTVGVRGPVQGDSCGNAGDEQGKLRGRHVDFTLARAPRHKPRLGLRKISLGYHGPDDTDGGDAARDLDGEKLILETG